MVKEREDESWKFFCSVVDAEACSVVDSLLGVWWCELTQVATSLSKKLV